MKESFGIIKEHFILLLGIALFIYGLSTFSFGEELIECYGGSYGNYCKYSNAISLTFLIIGVIFITIGLLKLKKYERKN